MKMITSPLGDTSQIYQVKSSNTGSIHDQPDKGLIELYPAGYTKPSDRDNANRQEVYKYLYEAATILGTESNLYPFKKDSHSVRLVPDPHNLFDSNAIHIILETTSMDSSLYPMSGRDLGFIPKRINKEILKNISMINSGTILKVKAQFHKKFYGAKIVLAYGNTTFSPMDSTGLKRFSAIILEE